MSLAGSVVTRAPVQFAAVEPSKAASSPVSPPPPSEPLTLTAPPSATHAAGLIEIVLPCGVADLESRFREFLRDYHARPHGESKIPPQVRWQHGGFVPRTAESLEQLAHNPS